MSSKVVSTVSADLLADIMGGVSMGGPIPHAARVMGSFCYFNGIEGQVKLLRMSIK